MIGIVNYGLGNIKAFANIYTKLDIPFTIATRALDLKQVTRVILPGVGAFDHAMELLEESGMREALDEAALYRRLPVLGICAGMQILARSSEEGDRPGLGWIDGDVKKFPAPTAASHTHIPHMGWNDVAPKKKSILFEGLEEDARFYFLHSYYFQCLNQDNVLAVTDYGASFASAIQSENICGVQFHPEKSHHYGIRLLKNFSK